MPLPERQLSAGEEGWSPEPGGLITGEVLLRRAVAETTPDTRSILWVRPGFLGTMGRGQGGRGGWLGAERNQVEKSGGQGWQWRQQELGVASWASPEQAASCSEGCSS